MEQAHAMKTSTPILKALAASVVNGEEGSPFAIFWISAFPRAMCERIGMQVPFSQGLAWAFMESSVGGHLGEAKHTVQKFTWTPSTDCWNLAEQPLSKDYNEEFPLLG